jgi:esterase/lipase
MLSLIAINYICEKIYDRIIHLKSLKSGLYDESENELINTSSQPFSLIRSSDEALIMIHGMCHTPAHFDSLFKHFKKNTNLDIYAPLLKYHGRKLEDQCKAKITLILEQLEKDINHVTSNKKYKKVYCLGHSFGSMLLMHMSIKEMLHKKVSLILYAVPLALMMPFFISIPALFIIRFINKYLFFLNFYGVDTNRGKSFAHQSTYYIPSTHLAFVISRFCFNVRNMLRNGYKILNNFCYVNVKDDKIVNSGVSSQILDREPNKIKGITLDEGSHSIHINTEYNLGFFGHIENFIRTLRSS